jgi:hypothetical protein
MSGRTQRGALYTDSGQGEMMDCAMQHGRALLFIIFGDPLANR